MSLVFDSPHWDQSIGVCSKHMCAQTPCPVCLETYDEDVVMDLCQEGKDIWNYGIPDEYLLAEIEDIRDFRRRQILFRKFWDCGIPDEYL